MSGHKITYRRTRQSDMLASSRLILQTISNMFKRNGRPPIKVRVREPWPLNEHWLRTDPEGSFVAVNEKGKIVGYVSALVREDEWYLADLFVMRSYQSKGVGSKLLLKALDYGARQGCRRRSLCTFSINEQAVAVYSKMGMTPQRPILELRRPLLPTNRPPTRLEPDIKLEYRELHDESLVNHLTRIEKKARGLRRPEEHFFWLSRPDYHVYYFRDGRKTAGFAVGTDIGGVGPVVAAKPEYLWSLLCYAVNLKTSENTKQQILYMPGENVEMVTCLLEAGFRVRQILLELGTEKLADLSIYIPGNLAYY
jgi:GNAT superfamily N-acetyltransferase